MGSGSGIRGISSGSGLIAGEARQDQTQVPVPGQGSGLAAAMAFLNGEQETAWVSDAPLQNTDGRDNDHQKRKLAVTTGGWISMDYFLPGTCREDTLNHDFQPVNVNGHWCSMSCSEVALWWDKDTDHTGRPIRPDVRGAAHRVWNCASKTAQTIIGDNSHAAELM